MAVQVGVSQFHVGTHFIANTPSGWAQLVLKHMQKHVVCGFTKFHPIPITIALTIEQNLGFWDVQTPSFRGLDF